MKTIFESCTPRPEVLKGELKDEIFRASLRQPGPGPHRARRHKGLVDPEAEAPVLAAPRVMEQMSLYGDGAEEIEDHD